MIQEKKAIAWTIAGSDSGGGAGVQADLATFHDFAVHGCSVITALTAQNSFAVGLIAPTPRKSIVAQINALDSDLPAGAIKIGMLANAEIITTVAKYLDDYDGFVVCDPVMRSSTGGSLLEDVASAAMISDLLPRVSLLTPNIPEAESLTDTEIRSPEDVVKAAQLLLGKGVQSVLITGGHFDVIHGRRVDYWTNGKESFWLAGTAIDTVHNHGSGCSLSAAIAAGISLGHDIKDALVLAKAYVTQGIRGAKQFGGGPGHVAHTGWPEQLEDYPELFVDFKSLLACEKKPTFSPQSSPLGLYPVVDSVEWVERLAKCGVKTIQIRIKDQADEFIEDAVQQSVAIAQHYGAQLFINDYWEIAVKAGAYGVHLGQEDLATAELDKIAEAGCRLGVSTHSYAEIARAHSIGPSYVAIGPIYPTTSKVMPFKEQGIDRLQTWVNLLSGTYPMTAIGGINLERAEDVLQTGVGSCAMITAITEADDYVGVVDKLLALHTAELG